jgi:lipopolysaccharide export system protein LptA
LRRVLTIFALILPCAAGEEDALRLPKSKFQATALLPPGSELKDVLFPAYDENNGLVSVLKAKIMTLVTPEQIAAQAVSIEFFNPDQSPRGHVNLVQALMNRGKGLFSADEPVEIQYDQMTSSGTGLRYFFEQRQGFLLGPVSTHIRQNPNEKTMKASSTKLPATAALGMTLLAQQLTAAVPAPMSSQEVAAIQADAAPHAPVAATAAAAAKASLAADLTASEKANQATSDLLRQADLPGVPAATIPAPDKPLDKKPSQTDTVITSDGGFYFDAAEGVFVYLKNVTVKDPRFTLSGANELKIFLAKKTPVTKDPKPKKETGLGGGFDGVERIVATGAIRVVKEASEGQERVEASAAIFTYHAKAEQITLSGGYPWIVRGNQYQRAKQPDLNLRIFLKPFSVVTEGVWETVLDIKQKP